jgi:hypothetical protein
MDLRERPEGVDWIQLDVFCQRDDELSDVVILETTWLDE